MRPIDKELKEFNDSLKWEELTVGRFDKFGNMLPGPKQVTLRQEQLDKLYSLVRKQALEDAGDYMVRIGNSVFNQFKRAGEDKVGRKIRSLFYGAASTIRGNGGEEQLEQMLKAMREGPPAPPDDEPEESSIILTPGGRR